MKIVNSIDDMEYIFDDIDFCEKIGNFNDDYVYDIEVSDNTHTFVANDILVHNSLFIGFKPAMDSCDWKDQVINESFLNDLDFYGKTYVVIGSEADEERYIKILKKFSGFKEFVNIIDSKDLQSKDVDHVIVCGDIISWRNKNDFDNLDIIYNIHKELDFIHLMDKHKYADYFKFLLEEHAKSYGVPNREDFELERINESMINIAKKKYIQHIAWEDGLHYDRLTYMFPKGVELVRSSTPVFAREKIVEIIKYLFAHPDTFNVKDLLKLVKKLRKEFELADIDDIAMQSSCSNYEEKVLCHEDRLEFVSGAHFAVKAAAFYNHLLFKNKDYQDKYEYLKSGSKIKYYYCKSDIGGIFAYSRGAYPIEFAPDVDYNEQFAKSILSPVNSIITQLGMPEITSRLTVVLDIFSGF